MWDFLKSIDPNLLTVIASGVVAAATWGYHKIRGDKQQSATDMAKAVIGNLAHELLDRYSDQPIEEYLATARVYIEDQIWSILAKRKVPRNSLTEYPVHLAIEEGTQWLAGQLAQLRQLGDHVTTLSTAADNLVSAMKLAEQEGLRRGRENSLVQPGEDPT